MSEKLSDITVCERCGHRNKKDVTHCTHCGNEMYRDYYKRLFLKNTIIYLYSL
jgi:ribosomal protein L40E